MDRRHLLRALAQAHDTRLYCRLRVAVAEIAEGKPVAVVAKHARVERSKVYRWIERYLAERVPCSLTDGKRSGRSRMTPALTHAVQQILARVPVAAHLATYLVRICSSSDPGSALLPASVETIAALCVRVSLDRFKAPTWPCPDQREANSGRWVSTTSSGMAFTRSISR